MKTMSKFLLLIMVLFMVGLGCVSAADVLDNNGTTTVQQDTSISSDISDISSSNTHSIDKVSDIQTTESDKNTVKTTTKNKKIIKNIATTTDEKVKTTEKINKTVKTTKNTDKTIKSSQYQITSSNYNTYFTFDRNKNRTVSSNLVQSGDTLDLHGTFTNVNFTIDKSNVTITSIGKTAKLYNCTVNIQGLNASGAKVENLTITNNNYYGSGVYVNITKNVLIANNTIHCWGPFAFALAADEMNNSLVIDNYLETSCREDTNRTHTAAAFGVSYYNNIVNNTVVSDQANGIYFSYWGSGLFRGGYCDHNNVTGNDVTGGDTSWSYTIQIMGTDNYIRNNTVRKGYRGISTQDFTNNYIIHNEVNATTQGIFACEGAIVKDNIVHVNDSTTGIEIGGDGVVVENNYVTSNSGSALVIGGSKANITNNTFWSTLGYGIYSKGRYTNIEIHNNNITSGKEGILFRKQSSSKKINYVNVTGNKVQSNGDFAIDFSEAGARDIVDSHIYVDESNVLNCTAGMGIEVAYNPPSSGTSDTAPDSNKTYTITESNYYDYFTDEQILKTSTTAKILKNDTIILSGTFTNKNFTFPIKVHVVGRNCRINNGTITFTSDASASTLTNVTIVNKDYNPNHYNRHAIEISEVSNCKVTNVNINNYDLWESFGIFLFSSSGNTITNNTIFGSGDYVNYPLFVYASDMNNITNNIIRLNQSNKKIEYADEIQFEDKIGSVKEVLHNYGILLLYSSNNIINNNDVRVTSLFTEYEFPHEDCKNSVVGIDVYYDSNFNSITNNKIVVNSYGPYEYGMGVLGAPWGTGISALNATNNTFRNNDVTVNGGYFATGFIAGLNSVGTIVDNNKFNVNALHNSTVKGDYTYGLTLESCTNTTFSNNEIRATAASLYTIEIFSSGYNKIINNTFYGEATHPYGVAGYGASDNLIQGNNFTLKEMPYGPTSSALHADAIPFGNNVIMFMTNSFRNNVTYNTLFTNASQYSVNLTEQAINNTIAENAIQSTRYIGDSAVTNAHRSNKISNNFLYFTDITVYPVQATVGYPMTLKATVTSTSRNLSSLTVTFRAGLTYLGTSKVNNDGSATLVVNRTNTLRPTTYTIFADVQGTNFQNSTGKATLNLNKTMSASTVTVNSVRGLPGNNVTFTATVTDSYSAKLSGNATFVLNGRTLATVPLNLGQATYTYRIPANTNPGVYNITVIYSGDKDYSASEGSNKLGVQSRTITTVSNTNGIIGNTATITARFTSNGRAISTGTATVRVNGANAGTMRISNGQGTYSYTIPTSMTARNYAIQVTFNGNDTLTSSTGTATLTARKMASTISYNTTNMYIGQNVTLIVKVSNSAKTYYANSGNITITINGQPLKDPKTNRVVTGYVNRNRNAIFTFTGPSQLLGKNNVTFTYLGNNQFNTATATYTNGFNVYNTGSIITARNVTAKLGNIVKLNSTIKDTTGKTITSGKVAVKINDKTFGHVNISRNGVITYNLNLTPSGFGKKDYKVSYVYGGTNTIAPAKTDIKLSITPYTPRINITLNTAGVGENVTMTVKINNGTGYNANSGTVGFKINGATYKINGKSYVIKVHNGVATFKFNVNKKLVGKNNITITYSGNDKFNQSRTTFRNALTVTNQKSTRITINPVTTIIGENARITAKFTGADGKTITSGKVAIKINGKTFGHVNIKNGTVTYTLKIDPKKFSAKKYNITIKFGGKNGYSGAEAKTTLTINKHTSKFTYTKATVKKGTTAKLTLKITDNKNTVKANNGTVGLKINGITYKVNNKAYIVKPINGTATFNIPTNNLKTNNNITFTYSGYREFNGLKQTYTNGLIINK